MTRDDSLKLERLVLEGDISLESHLPLIKNILNDENGGHLLIHIKTYLQLIFGGASRYWEYLKTENINIASSSLPHMYEQYTKLVSIWQSSSVKTDILIFAFQGNVSECLPRFHLCNTRLVPKFAGSGIYKDLNRLGYKASMIQFRDCVQMWYEEDSVTQHIVSQIHHSINRLSPRHVVFLGSSAGGYAALKYYHLSKISDTHVNQQVIANGPQFDVFTPSFELSGESYRQTLWEINGAHPITLRKYWRKNDGRFTILYGDKCKDDYLAADQISELSQHAKLIPINSEHHAPATRKDFIKEIISSFHNI